MSDLRDDDHDHGLVHDLRIIGDRVMERRRALAWLASAGGAAIVAGSGVAAAAQIAGGRGGLGSTSGGVITVGGGGSGGGGRSGSSSSSSASSSSSTTSSSSSACIADPSETSGPYPADGTNTSSGSTGDILTVSGIVRSDIRKSFISTTTDAGGVLVTITLTLVNVNAACAPLAGYAVYLWHADRYGHYSLYTAAAESYLRGVQVTNSNGQVTFTTYFPPAYDGRWPHYHFEVFSSLASAVGGKYAVLTSQLCMPAALCNTIFADTTTYPTAASIFKGESVSTDAVFGSSTSAQIAQQTPTFAGSVASGYTATALIGIAL